MKKLYAAIIICSFMAPLHAQVLKKLKGQFEDKFKEKIEQKKNQKIDEKTDNAASKIMNAPDSVLKKAGNFIKERRQDKKDSLKVKEQQKTDTLNTQVARAVVITSAEFSNHDTELALLLIRNSTTVDFFYKVQQLRTGSFNRRSYLLSAWMQNKPNMNQI